MFEVKHLLLNELFLSYSTGCGFFQVCGKTFTYKHGLKMHLALHEVQKQFKCELCEKSFVTKRSLQEHMSIHTGK